VTTSASLALCVVLSALPASAASGVWSDNFHDLSHVAAHQNVAIGGGSVTLFPDGVQRQGLQLGNSSEMDSPSIVKVGTLWYMYYAIGISSSGHSIALATSPDGNSWAPQAVVISPGFSGAADSQSAGYEKVVLVGNTFHMWYSGSDSSYAYAIIHATSSDGRSWTSHGVVLSATMLGISGFLVTPYVLWNGTGYTMWFAAYNGTAIFLWRAVSANGDVWTEARIVMSPAVNGYDDTGERWPFVIPQVGGFVMWYTCGSLPDPQICRAHSADGANWIREGIFLSSDPSLPLESSAVFAPDVVQVAPGTYRMWYGGRGPYGQIFSGLLGPGYVATGFVASTPVVLPDNWTIWQSLNVDKVEPSGTAIRISVLNATSGIPLGGYTDLTATSVSLAGINSRTVTSIQLIAVLVAGLNATPILHSYSVAYGPPPASSASIWELYGSLFLVLGIAAGGAGAIAVVLFLAMRRPPPQT